jgi:hypothetical protein
MDVLRLVALCKDTPMVYPGRTPLRAVQRLHRRDGVRRGRLSNSATGLHANSVERATKKPLARGRRGAGITEVEAVPKVAVDLRQ